MATYDTSGKYGLRALLGASGIAEIDDGFAALRNDVRDNMAGFAQGVFGARPAAAAGNAGMIYQATDSGQVFISTGSVWIPITGPVDKQVNASAAFTEGTLSNSFSTIMSQTFTPPFPNLEYQVWVNAGIFIALGSAGTCTVQFSFQLDGADLFPDTNAFLVSETGGSGDIFDQQPAFHFPVIVPSGSHTLRVQAKKASASHTAVVRSFRRMSAIALGYGLG